MDDTQLKLVFGDEAITNFNERKEIEQTINELTEKHQELLQLASETFDVDLSLTDIIVASATGVLVGALNGCFKSYIPKHGKFKHKHSTTRTAVDYRVPKPEGHKGSVQGLHRQIGPGHDIGRFKEALELMSGEKTDFKLWGKNISDYTGGLLHSGNMRVDTFIENGGFKIPSDPKKELINHFIIDFFTKTSLPLPFSSYIADSNEMLAKLMIGLYDEGLNMKNMVGNSSATAITQLVMKSYVFLFKAVKETNFIEEVKCLEEPKDFLKLLDELNSANKEYINSNEFNVLQMIAHGSSFLIDTVITMSSKNYAGLMSLNYASLITLATHTVKYISSGMKEKKMYLNEINEINLAIENANNEWFVNFKKNVLELSQKENFNETFSPNLIIEKHETVMQKLHESNDRRTAMMNELQEWSIDEEV